jgi:hypothetical protein
VGYYCKFLKTASNKQSPIGQKFAESGHPSFEWRDDTTMELEIISADAENLSDTMDYVVTRLYLYIFEDQWSLLYI